MKVVGVLVGVVVVWIIASALLAWQVAEVHTWWPFVPEMGFGTAMAVTLPAVVFGIIQELIKD